MWGYGIHDTAMRSPTSYRDYMSYCSQSWVSDFGWEKTFDIIAALTSWDAEGPLAPRSPGAGPVVVGMLSPGAEARWYTTMGALPRGGRSPDTFVEFTVAGATVRAPAAALPIPDSDAISVVAALPTAPFSKLSFRTGGKIASEAPAAAVVQLHAE